MLVKRGAWVSPPATSAQHFDKVDIVSAIVQDLEDEVSLDIEYR